MISFIDFLLPNFNLFTIIGLLLIILGVFILFMTAFRGGLMGLPTKAGYISGLVTVGLGLILSFGVSFVEDIFSSEKGTITVVALLFLVLVMWLILREPNRRKKR